MFAFLLQTALFVFLAYLFGLATGKLIIGAFADAPSAPPRVQRGGASRLAAARAAPAAGPELAARNTAQSGASAGAGPAAVSDETRPAPEPARRTPRAAAPRPRKMPRAAPVILPESAELLEVLGRPAGEQAGDPAETHERELPAAGDETAPVPADSPGTVLHGSEDIGREPKTAQPAGTVPETNVELRQSGELTMVPGEGTGDVDDRAAPADTEAGLAASEGESVPGDQRPTPVADAGDEFETTDDEQAGAPADGAVVEQAEPSAAIVAADDGEPWQEVGPGADPIAAADGEEPWQDEEPAAEVIAAADDGEPWQDEEPAASTGFGGLGGDPQGADDDRTLGLQHAAQAADEPVFDDEQPVGLEAPRGLADDLKRIRGVGPQNEQSLNLIGIWHYSQIAEWTDAEAEWVSEYLGFQGRVLREDWIGQAAILAAGAETEYSIKSDRREASHPDEV